jgi:crotonobetainyl-CoA:carnitine CoA-transferase CaiB-like acyl-CoA transferase
MTTGASLHAPDIGAGNAPLAGVRVLSLGGIWAGRLASMLLADQGAEVIEINNPAATPSSPRALLSRGKHEIGLDLASENGRREAKRLATDAHIVIDNLGAGRSARFGLDYLTLKASNEKLVYVSMPAAATGTSSEGTGEWEGSIAASVGVYTDIHSLGPVLGGKPTFTAIPMASAYGGVHAAIAASAGFFNRLTTGQGSHIEVPLRDALLSAMALLIMKIENQPQYFDLPPVEKSLSEVAMPILRDLNDRLSDEHRAAIRSHLAQHAQPFFANHLCADGRFVFVNAMGHVHQARACLETLGILDELIADGMVVSSPYDVGGAGNNVSDAGGLTTYWKQRVYASMTARLRSKPAHEWEHLLQQAAVPVSVVRTADEWLNWPVAHEAENVVTFEDPDFGRTQQAGRFVTIEGQEIRSPKLQPRTKSSGEWTDGLNGLELRPLAVNNKILDGIRVLDLSNVIAGPLAGRVLAELGAEVTRIDPVSPQAGPRMTMWFGVDVNQGKRAIILDLKSQKGREAFERLVRESDIVLHNYLDHSLSGLGISEEQLRTLNPNVITCQVSAWGGPAGGPFKNFPAYDPVLQAATGITTRYGSPTAPVLHGVASCVDYITGFAASLGILQALIARALGRGSAAVRTSLAMGAQLVQFPFMVRNERGPVDVVPSGQQASGYGAHYRIYKAHDDWVIFCSRAADLAKCAAALGANNPSEESLAAAIEKLGVAEISRSLENITAATVTRVTRLDRLREEISVPEPSQAGLTLDGRSLLMVEADHPSGHRIALPFPSWYRSSIVPPARLVPAPKPGTHTVEVLKEIGFDGPDIQSLLEQRAAAKGWSISREYFPSPRRSA